MAARFNFTTLTPGTIEIGPFTVVTGRLSHPVETFGFRLSQGGQTIAYSADTGVSDTLVDLAADADLFLCEASFPEVDGLPANLHLTAREAGQHAARAGAGELILTHLVPWNSKDQLIDQAGAEYDGPISLAQAGRQVRLGR